MNVYDTVNKLAQEIKDSQEYKDFKQAKDIISNIPEYKEKIAEFEKLRYEEQITRIQEGKIDEEKLKKVQEIYKEIIEITEVKNYFDTELKFNILLGDVNKIISDAVKDLV